MSIESQSDATPPATPAVVVLGSPEMAKLWPDFPPRTRAMLLAAAGRQWFELWQNRVAPDEIPPQAWGWNLTNARAPLVLPPHLIIFGRSRISQTRLVLALAAWLQNGSPARTERERLRVLSSFAKCAALDRAARRNFYARVRRAARRIAAMRAREVYREVLAETEDHCRQSVHCRGIWMPDSSLTADEMQHAIEAALRAPEAHVIKQSGVASVVRSHVLGEFVVIKRHRLSQPGKRLKYLWRMSRARRAWAAGIAMRRLGLPAAEPMGFLEITKRGRVTDNFIITRWLPDCRTARDGANDLHARSERRSAIASWRDEWLRLIERGLYHADTKLSNALVQTNGSGRAALFWTDLECVEAGAPLTKYRVMRNIVQMNGSLGADFSVRDRLFFLRGLPSRFGWLRSRWCRRIIAAWTERRKRSKEPAACVS